MGLCWRLAGIDVLLCTRSCPPPLLSALEGKVAACLENQFPRGAMTTNATGLFSCPGRRTFSTQLKTTTFLKEIATSSPAMLLLD